MSNTTILKVHFLAEWTPANFSGMDLAIAKHFKHGVFNTHRGTHFLIGAGIRAIDRLLGLAYTSSSSFAMYSICNVELKYDEQFNYIGFGISGDSKYYAILWDKDENEKIIEL